MSDMFLLQKRCRSQVVSATMSFVSLGADIRGRIQGCLGGRSAISLSLCATGTNVSVEKIIALIDLHAENCSRYFQARRLNTDAAYDSGEIDLDDWRTRHTMISKQHEETVESISFRAEPGIWEVDSEAQLETEDESEDEELGRSARPLSRYRGVVTLRFHGTDFDDWNVFQPGFGHWPLSSINFYADLGMPVMWFESN